MEKSMRAELIAALVTDRYSGFKDEDTAMLETCADARLEEFRAASDSRKAAERERTKLESDLTKVEARAKVAEERLRVAEQGPSEEEWLAKAPPSVKALLDAQKAEEDAVRSSIVSQLKDLGENTEAELKAMPLEQLRQLASYARVHVPDFSGRGLPVERHASGNKNNTVNYAPPDPYAAGLKQLQAAGSKLVN